MAKSAESFSQKKKEKSRTRDWFDHDSHCQRTRRVHEWFNLDIFMIAYRKLSWVKGRELTVALVYPIKKVVPLDGVGDTF